MQLRHSFKTFFNSDKAGGIILVLCAAVSLWLANSTVQSAYTGVWHTELAGAHLEHWINDGLMAIFFLLIGLELKQEIATGALSSYKRAMLPVFAAIGGMLTPAGIHLFLNYNTPTQSGAGIPMATDIAFALGILSLLGKRVPAGLKVFLTALAVIDDLGAILTIAVFYSKGLSFLNLGIASGIFLLLALLNRFKVRSMIIYLLGGIALWYFMLHSGIHATIAGVLLAFVIPSGKQLKSSPSYRLQHFLHKPVTFFILPVFALANTAIPVNGNIADSFRTQNGMGIFLGLLVGKPLGIFLFSLLAVRTRIATRPDYLKWRYILGVGLLGGIGFTMSIFITLLAFDDTGTINHSKIAIILTSALSAIAGFIALGLTLPRKKI